MGVKDNNNSAVDNVVGSGSDERVNSAVNSVKESFVSVTFLIFGSRTEGRAGSVNVNNRIEAGAFAS